MRHQLFGALLGRRQRSVSQLMRIEARLGAGQEDAHFGVTNVTVASRSAVAATRLWHSASRLGRQRDGKNGRARSGVELSLDCAAITA